MIHNGTNSLIVNLLLAFAAACVASTVVGCGDGGKKLEKSRMNMQRIVLAMHNHHDVKRDFPAYCSTDQDGKPLLSWRVRILPFLDAFGESEFDDLYMKFRLDEPWDSEHNKKLISQMPAIYLDPRSKLQVTDGKTHYLGPKGEDFAFTGTSEQVGFRDFPDGTSSTITLLQVNDGRATIWTKPDDWEYDESEPLRGLVPCLQGRTFVVAAVDGRTGYLTDKVAVEEFHGLLTRNGGEIVEKIKTSE